MTPNFLQLLLLSIFSGLGCGMLLYAGKYAAWFYKKPIIDIIFSIIRFVIFITFSYSILQFVPSNSILLLGVFLLSYIGTIIAVIKKTS